jgi:hypothetical protein
MQRPTFVKVPIVSAAVLSLPPMYAWPALVKQALVGVCAILCIIAYVAMVMGIIGLTTIALAFL